jgi:hypothetical protein
MCRTKVQAHVFKLMKPTHSESADQEAYVLEQLKERFMGKHRPQLPTTLRDHP